MSGYENGSFIIDKTGAYYCQSPAILNTHHRLSYLLSHAMKLDLKYLICVDKWCGWLD